MQFSIFSDEGKTENDLSAREFFNLIKNIRDMDIAHKNKFLCDNKIEELINDIKNGLDQKNVILKINLIEIIQ